MSTNTLTGIAGVHVTASRRVTIVVVITHDALIRGTTRGGHSVTRAVGLGEEVHIHKASGVQETSGDLRSSGPLGGLSTQNVNNAGMKVMCKRTGMMLG